MKLAVAGNQMSKRIVPSNDYYKALRKVAEGVEAINRPAITFVPGESRLDSKLTVEVQSPLDPTMPANEWNSTNSVKKRYAILGEDGTSEDFAKLWKTLIK